ncbi:hypothetical protein DICSQDRAFT_66872 [Dichomitus squalens LYAD-421 SS1]|uniref:Pyridoxamine 5'-phosphate oxidase N-terminal domain-containing protein n=1 Tax=Dichomitus squalens (strain LYAD-421) TaxID=732165 RepID=R7SRG6_DICSQ|nr:uncharacterized protein DICSQDRAFT_66872 [Dichomitus squalens LYAD-421 SS1]EJF58548.1 hypothetical protein DICSQDRAFT_66872 [Dichomitus squalens LYAD-421 SS1]
MGQFYDEIPETHIAWIKKQEMFFVATAPLSADGHVNVSPKGVRDSFHVESRSRVWYEDLSGSGIETISHLKENKRITIMFCALEGAARILRIWGTGRVFEFGTPEYEELIPSEKRMTGSRAAIVVDVHKVGTSCGYAVPIYTFKSHRSALLTWSEKMEKLDEDFAADPTACPHGPEALPRSMKWWWAGWNLRSIDGLPGLDTAHVVDAVPRMGEEAKRGLKAQGAAPEPPSDGTVVILGNRVPRAGRWEAALGRLTPASGEEAVRLVLACSLGMAIAAICVGVVGMRTC